VIGTDNDAAAARAADKLMSTVLTNIEKGADLAIPAFDREQAFFAQIESHIVTGIFQLARMAGELPRARQQSGFFDLEDLWIGVVPRIKRPDRTCFILHSGSSM
jgi:hypothetical protein